MPKTILVVDDIISACHLMIRCLAIIGVKANCAESGAEAFASMAQTRPAMVFLDYMMPEMDGLEVLSRMKADATLKTIPVVMFTANDSRKFRHEALRLGAIGILVKGTATLKDFHHYVSGLTIVEQADESHAIMIAGNAEGSHAIKVCNGNS